MAAPRTFAELWDWIRGRDPLPPPDPDKVVEAAWVELWMSRIVVSELEAAGIPAQVVDDTNIHAGISAGPGAMARIFVTEDRQAEARELIEDFLGHPPRRRGI